MTVDEVNANIGRRLKALMAYRKVEPHEMAERLNMTTWKIARVCSGTSALSAADLVLAAEVLNVNSANITGEILFSDGM